MDASTSNPNSASTIVNDCPINSSTIASSDYSIPSGKSECDPKAATTRLSIVLDGNTSSSVPINACSEPVKRNHADIVANSNALENLNFSAAIDNSGAKTIDEQLCSAPSLLHNNDSLPKIVSPQVFENFFIGFSEDRNRKCRRTMEV